MKKNTKQSVKQLKEISNLKFSTKRATVAKLEKILYKPHKVLDHGFIRVIDYMGDDSSIVQAARVSYGKGTKKIKGGEIGSTCVEFSKTLLGMVPTLSDQTL